MANVTWVKARERLAMRKFVGVPFQYYNLEASNYLNLGIDIGMEEGRE